MEIFKLVFSPIEVNTYIVADDDGNCVIIDCGCYYPEEEESLLDFLAARKLKPVRLLNTHCHLDHIFGNEMLFKKFGLRPWSSELEESNRKNSPQHAMLFGLRMDPSPEPEKFIVAGETLDCGSIQFQVFPVPGHTVGSLAFYSVALNCVFTGDALFSGTIGRTDLPGGNLDTLLASIKGNLLTLPEETVVYPGHGPETTIAIEKRTNPYLV
ncbi:MAG: MBL fold metallo-hydrolase [Bacteroidales bacterium]